jgi:acetylornithine deacetylase/succinyl-diaminopimelate desuccinylase-like protein
MTEITPLQPVRVLFPDVTTDLILHLRPLLVVDVPTVRLCINLGTWRRPQPCVQIVRVGGKSTGLIDSALLQVDVRHSDWDTTSALTSLVRMYLNESAAHVDGIKRIVEASGPRWFPDMDGGARMMWTVAVSVSGAQT